ncbi:HAF repeat-containing protein [Frankia sp. QA3]|uniref:HAF repeat-containing protein n=1 Tax=Frankia sp. QA3 TaxID=710111 RepID=UPI00031BE93D|nr:HAF repeat-containing protein [Frankia sp. QA3]
MDLGALPDLPTTGAVDINSRGEVIGLGQESDRAWPHGIHWRGGRIERLPDGANVVRSINQAGQITGIEGPVSRTNGFVIPPGGALVGLPFLPSDQNESGLVVGTRYPMSNLRTVAMTWFRGHLRTLTPPAGYAVSIATGVNERGQIAGTLEADNGGSRAALWTDGQWTVLPLPPGADKAYASDVNDRGDVVGRTDAGLQYNPTIWSRGRALVISDRTGEATAISNRGDVIGYLESSDQRHAFHWQGGRLTEINPDGTGWSDAVDVTDDGLVVGNTSDNTRSRGFRWNNGRVEFLGALGGADSYASAVNNRGQIVGAALLPDGQRHAARWNP